MSANTVATACRSEAGRRCNDC